MSKFYGIYESPIGSIYMVVNEIGVCKIELFESNWIDYLKKNQDLELNQAKCREVIVQLEEYFHKKRKTFDLPLSIEGTNFRKKVWDALLKIPYGKTKNYQQIAEEINQPKAIRAVGQANKANDLPIIIPCHRVIGKSGKLVGYAGDKTDMKEYLLHLEGLEL